VSLRFSPQLRCRNLYNIAFACAVSCGLLVHASAQVTPSLVGRSNEELLAIIRGGVTNRPPAADIKLLVLPPNFWSLPSRDAALAFVLSNCSDATKRRVTFSIAEPAKRQPPEKGEVGIRWDAPGSGPMAGGLTVLRAAGEKSLLAYSAVELAGEASKREIRIAIDRTTTVPLPPEVARHAFQVIWWLGRVRQTGEPEYRHLFVDHQTAGTFWIQPGLPRTRSVTLLEWPLGSETGEEFNIERHAGFAHFLISGAAKQQPKPIESVTATLGEGVYPDKALKFLRTEPRPRRQDETESWITHTVEILRNPKYPTWRWFAINNLVPWQEPMRYRDSRIDAALRAVADENVTKAPRTQQRDDRNDDSAHAAQGLAWRDCTEIFPALLATLRRAHDNPLHGEDLLTAAALLASRHPELRSAMIEYLREQLADISHSKHAYWDLFEVAWRFDFRELQPLLASLATTNADEVEDVLRTAAVLPRQPAAPRHFHEARKIVLIWSEPDLLTQLKLDALWEASSTALFQPADHLRNKFEQLDDPGQQAFRQFVEWMKRQNLASNWQPRRVDWAISPEALAAAE